MIVALPGLFSSFFFKRVASIFRDKQDWPYIRIHYWEDESHLFQDLIG